MERLTEWNIDHTHGQMAKHGDGYTRLAEYEDTGLTPEEVAEMAKIVRCKDCKHYERSTECHFHKADINGTPIFVRENDFCSYGERKENHK